MTTVAVKEILPARPFFEGMATAFDIYGSQGLDAFAQIQEEWRRANALPVPSADESIRDSIASMNREYFRLLAEHAE